MPNLLNYNAFGLITVTKKKIKVNVTSQAEKRYISRTVSNDCNLSQVGPDETIVVTFGAWVESDKQSLVTFHEHEPKLQSGQIVSEIPEVNQVLKETLNILKKSVFN